MNLDIVAVGRAKGVLERPAQDYARRAGHYWKLQVREVSDRDGGANRAEILKRQAARIRKALPSRGIRVALTRTGRQMDSADLAEWLDGQRTRGAGRVVFILGGAFGLDPSIIRAADLTLSLSAATLPHDLARVVLLEQIYRAGTILRGEPYHKGTA